MHVKFFRKEGHLSPVTVKAIELINSSKK